MGRNTLRFSATEVDSIQKKNPVTRLLTAARKIKEPGMNKTETRFSLLLEEARVRGEIRRWQFEEITLKTGPSTRYKPDFVAVLPSGHWQFFEIKGFLRDDAAVKFKTAAEKYPEISFMMIREKAGDWEIVYNLPSKTKPEERVAKHEEKVLPRS